MAGVSEEWLDIYFGEEGGVRIKPKWLINQKVNRKKYMMLKEELRLSFREEKRKIRNTQALEIS